MVARAEARWQDAVDAARTPGHIVYALAAVAAKVVVVGEVGPLIARGLARQSDGVQPPGLRPSANGSVHRRDAQPRRRTPRELPSLLRRQRSIGLLEHCAQRPTLSRAADVAE